MAEKILKCGIKREEGYLYYVDKDGDISRVMMHQKAIKMNKG